ncbi:MAG: hypothetical protein OXG68_11575 [Chloroflexi bacterium]|nr:hypothetical protein [Chloroflexota bacterium]
MVYHICQIWGDSYRLVLAAFETLDEVDEFLLTAKADGSLRLWGEVQIIEIEGIARYSTAQWLRSQRVNETIDGLSPGRRRPEYGNEYVRSLDGKTPQALMRYDHAPYRLQTDEFPLDHLDPPAGPNWCLRTQIGPFSEAGRGADYACRWSSSTRCRSGTWRCL